MNYILDENGKPRYEPDVRVWAEWFEKADRTIARTEVNGLIVWTIFLGHDAGFGFDDKKLLYETSIFRGSDRGLRPIQTEELYTTRTEAMAGHARLVELAEKL